MQYTIKTVEQVKIVEIVGEIDGKTASGLQQQLLSCIQPGINLLLDLSEVYYMSSAGLRMLLSLYRQVGEARGQLVLVGLSDEIRDAMSVTGFLAHFTICPTREAGLTFFQGLENA